MSTFLDMLNSNIRHANSLLDKANEITAKGCEAMHELCDNYSGYYYSTEGRKATLYHVRKSGKLFHRVRHDKILEFYPYDNKPGSVMFNDGGGGVLCLNISSLEAQIRETFTRYHTIGKYK